VWDANFLQVDEVDDAITAGDLAQEADRLMGPRGLAHRKIQLDDEALGSRLAPDFEGAGWDVHRLLVMVHNGEDIGPPSTPVDEITDGVHAAAKDEFNRRDPYIAEQKVVDEMRGLARRVSEATDKRCFAAYVEDEIASVCELYSDGLTAQIEDVATLEEHRKKGLAQAVVRRALHEAQTWGHETIFLVADHDDWPKEMYAKLGFEEAGRTFQFLLKPQT
jgi:GNAT superfamily N-acetyltransferase